MPLQQATHLSAAQFDRLLAACLAACRDNTLSELVAERPRLARRACAPLAALMSSTLGDAQAPGEGGRTTAAFRAFLGWAICSLRPDQRGDWSGLPHEAWLHRTSWRSVLALACHHGFVPVPSIPGRFLGSSSDSVVNRLCTLWDVGPSTYYRYLEKGRQRMASRLAGVALGATEMLSYRAYVLATEGPAENQAGADMLAWHRRLSEEADESGDVAAALWHGVRGAHGAGLVRLLQSKAADLARSAETPLLLSQVDAACLPFPEVIDWHLACAEVARSRGEGCEDLAHLERALELARREGTSVYAGRALLALGDYYQSRDADRALACYQEAADRLTGAEEDDACDTRVQSLNRLAWAFALKKDARASTLLHEADALCGRADVTARTRGLLALTWGEYSGRAGDAAKELEHKHRALVIFEAAGDRRNVLSVCNNLSIAYSRQGAFVRAIEYADRLLDVRAHRPIETLLLVSALGNKGGAQFYLGRYSDAIDCYLEGLRISEQSQLKVEICRMHFNLAEAYLKRHESSGDPADRAAGERHIDLTLGAEAGRSQPHLLAAAQALRPRDSAEPEVFSLDRLVPDNHAMHAEQMGVIQHHRAVLALPTDAETRVRSHLELARAYMTIAAGERDRALALIQKEQMQRRFALEMDALRHTFDRQLTREQRVQAAWQGRAEQAGLMLAEARRVAILEHLFANGSIQKSGYARLCGVGLATASKHLTTLAELGLLVQMGRGPSTRYRLAEEPG